MPRPDPLMTVLRYLHLDVFAATPGGGNHLGVVIGADVWSTEAMQRFARWTALVETTFLLPVLWQECDAGVLPIRVDDSGPERELLLQSPGERVLATGLEAHPLLAATLAGIHAGTLPPALVDGGRRWWLAEVADEATLRSWQPDHAAIGALAHASDSMGLCVFARSQSRPAASSRHTDYQLVVRAFPAGVGIVEDPASGAANGLIAAYIAHAEPAGALAHGYTVSQGREIGHDARLTVRIDGASIWVGGHSHTVIDGTLDWSHA